MNFSISDSIGPLGSFILFGALMIVFIVAAVFLIRLIRGQDEAPPVDRVLDDEDMP